MSSLKSTTADLVGAPTSATLPTPTTPPESARRATLQRQRPTLDGTSARAESVRVTDVPAMGRGRAYLVERELEHDGFEALNALVADYLDQAAVLDDVPMAVSPLTGTRGDNVEAAER